MTNPPRKKGTAEETAIVIEWNDYFDDGPYARRTPAGSRYDIHVDGWLPPVEVLSTRADRGERLITLRFSDFMALVDGHVDPRPEIYIESKRYARFALHTIFFAKFGRKR